METKVSYPHYPLEVASWTLTQGHQVPVLGLSSNHHLALCLAQGPGSILLFPLSLLPLAAEAASTSAATINPQGIYLSEIGLL